jgi:molybdenum cofactor guanylyltransferase
LHETVGVLLAGGESSRFGGKKAFAKFMGQSFWEHSYFALKGASNQQVIISHQDLINQFKEMVACQVLVDDEKVKGRGPLAGIYTAMKNIKAEWYVVVSCDIPFISEQTLHRLLDMRSASVTAVIPKVNGKLHPLIGVYHHSIFAKLEKQLSKHEYKMMSFLEKIDVIYVSEQELAVDAKVFSNINSQEDYTKLLSNGKISESYNRPE